MVEGGVMIELFHAVAVLHIRLRMGLELAVVGEHMLLLVSGVI